MDGGTRVDRWIWAVRLVKTRSLATQACKAGHVQVNGNRVKPATTVSVGDTVRARIGERERVVEVVRLIETRVGAKVAAECLVDHSPPPPARDPMVSLGALGLGRRDPGTGRPTKRDRRQVDRVKALKRGQERGRGPQGGRA